MQSQVKAFKIGYKVGSSKFYLCHFFTGARKPPNELLNIFSVYVSVSNIWLNPRKYVDRKNFACSLLKGVFPNRLER